MKKRVMIIVLVELVRLIMGLFNEIGPDYKRYFEDKKLVETYAENSGYTDIHDCKMFYHESNDGNTYITARWFSGDTQIIFDPIWGKVTRQQFIDNYVYANKTGN